MDKDLLRFVIIGAGALVFLIVLMSGLWQGRSKKSKMYYGNRNPLDNIDNALVVNMSEDEFDIVPVPLGSNTDTRFDDQEPFDQYRGETTGVKRAPDEDLQPEQMFADLGAFDETEQESEPELEPIPEPEPELVAADILADEKRANMPELIQFSLIANFDNGFNGADIANLLQNAGLVYGDLKIFERLDAQKRVDYGVASMVNPGTFPEQELHLFHCPGITFFMQPRELDEPLVVLNELISLLFLLSRQLDGDILDGQRKPLDEQAIDSIRKQLTL